MLHARSFLVSAFLEFKRSISSCEDWVTHKFQIVVSFLLALFNWHKIAPCVTLVNLTRAHNLVVGIVKELVPMCQPSSDSWNCEKHGKHLSGNTECLVDYS